MAIKHSLPEDRKHPLSNIDGGKVRMEFYTMNGIDKNEIRSYNNIHKEVEYVTEAFKKSLNNTENNQILYAVIFKISGKDENGKDEYLARKYSNATVNTYLDYRLLRYANRLAEDLKI